MAIMAELHQEHVNLKRLLDILARKVEKFRAGSRPNFQLMSDVVSYVGGYADAHHHPREDRMFSYFSGRDDKVDALMAQCEKQHAELHQLSTHLELLSNLVYGLRRRSCLTDPVLVPHP